MNDSTDTGIGQRMRAARDANNLRQGDIANKLGVSRPAVAMWESNTKHRTNCSVDNLRKFAEITHVPLEMLLDEKATATDIWKQAMAYRKEGPGARQVVVPAGIIPGQHGNDTIMLRSERAADGFWAAAEFFATDSHPTLISRFRAPVGKLGLQIDLMCDRAAFAFLAEGPHTHEDILQACGKLLLAERVGVRPLAKHVLVWARNSVKTEVRDVHAATGVEVRHVNTPAEAADLIQQLCGLPILQPA